MGWLARSFLLWLALCASPAAWPAGLDTLGALNALDVQAGPKLPVDAAVQWCAAAADASVDDVVGGACQSQAVDSSGVVKVGSSRAFWGRLALHNTGALPLERWLEMGYPQMTQISLYVPTAGGWQVHEAGASVALEARGPVERNYGVFPLQVAAHSQQVVWVRMASSTIVSLSGVLWEPDALRATLARRHFWGSMALGGLCLTVLFSLLMLALTRQSAYGFFALGLLGQFVSLSVPSGLFQRFVWPHDLPMFPMVREVGAMVAIWGLYRFLLVFLPKLSRYPVLLRLYHVAAMSSLLAILADVLTQRLPDNLWFVAVVVSVLLGVLLCARCWWDGDRAAGIILLAFCNFLAIGCLRLAVAFGSIPLVPQATMLPFLAIFFGSPLILLGLVDRTRQLHDDLLRVQAESAAQLRFLAQMSHELRSPLDNILGNAQLLAREARSASQTSGLNSIFDSGRQLLNFIDHILEYARGAAGMLRIDPAPLRLGLFLRGIERMSQLLAVQRNNRFVLQFDGDPRALSELSVMADAERLRQVLVNLLGNAARHTGDGVITLRVGAQPQADARLQLVFSVSDTGEGIALQEQERIFRPFERGSSNAGHASYGDKGAGLGLAIARQLVELMGGRLTVQSTRGQGACFRFWVPVQGLRDAGRVAPERLEGFDAAGYLGPRRTVLVVDDSAASRAVLGGLLNGLGFEVLMASSGRAAAARVPGLDRLDLVLTDQFMPDGDGWQVLETLGTLLPEVPVVLVSAAPPSPPAGWSGRWQFAAQFLRPLDHAALLACIGDLLDLHWSEAATLERAAPGMAAPAPAPALGDLRTLAQLIERGQVTAVQEWAQTLKAAQPQHARFADQVIEAVRLLDLQALHDLANGPSARR